MSDAAESFHGHAHFAAPPPGVTVRHDWTLPEVRALYELPLLELVHKAQTVHRAIFQDNKVQLCSLLSIKTGGCPEDCSYCPQAARYKTGVKAERLMAVEEVLEAAARARAAGATRFCMGAAWREVKDGPQFDSVLEMVKGVRRLGMEACATLGMLTESQAKRLREAGLSAYNHNLDTSAEHYGDIISTRTYEDRLHTLERVRQAGISVCSGGIIGLGESVDDRCKLLMTLANQEVHPESVPINAIVRTISTVSTRFCSASGVPSTATSALMGTDSGWTSWLAKVMSSLQRSSRDSPRPMIPPEHTEMPASRTRSRVRSRSS